MSTKYCRRRRSASSLAIGSGKPPRCRYSARVPSGVHAPELQEVEREELDGDVPSRQHGRQFTGQEMWVRNADHESKAAQPLELRSQPSCPTVHPLDLVQKDRERFRSRPKFAERACQPLERFKAETARETGILEVDEQTVPLVEPIPPDQLREQSGLSAATVALDHQRGAIRQQPGQFDSACNDGGGDRSQKLQVAAMSRRSSSSIRRVNSTDLISSILIDSSDDV